MSGGSAGHKNISVLMIQTLLESGRGGKQNKTRIDTRDVSKIKQVQSDSCHKVAESSQKIDELERLLMEGTAWDTCKGILH